jgi:ribonuclease D
MASSELNNEDIGRWLWFRSSVATELLGNRGFTLDWYTAETGGIHSTSGYRTHFGINSSDLITVYAYDVARLASWEQHIWAAHNVAPEGKVSNELLAAQVKSQPASTHAVEVLLFQGMRMLEAGFQRAHQISLFTHDIDDAEAMQQISRFVSKDHASLLRLAKELVRVFSDRLNIRDLRNLSIHAEKD